MTSRLCIWGIVVPAAANVFGNAERTRDCDVPRVNSCQHNSTARNSQKKRGRQTLFRVEVHSFG